MIRRILIEDIDQVVEVARLMHGESNFSGFVPFCEESIRNYTRRSIHDDNYAAILCECDNEIAGFISGSVHPLKFNNNYIQGSEDFWYMAPKYRRTAAGIKLLSVFIHWCRDMGASSIQVTDSALIEPDKVRRVLDRFGFQGDGLNYRKVL